MTVLRSYAGGSWITPDDEGRPVLDAVTGDEVARVSSAGVDLAAALDHGRSVGGPALRDLPNDTVYVEGPPEALGRGGTFVGQHVLTPLRGVAVQINAFNFPVWGPLEKFAPAFIAG